MNRQKATEWWSAVAGNVFMAELIMQKKDPEWEKKAMDPTRSIEERYDEYVRAVVAEIIDSMSDEELAKWGE